MVLLLTTSLVQAEDRCNELIESEARRLNHTVALIHEGSRARAAHGIELEKPRDEFQAVTDNFRQRMAPCHEAETHRSLSPEALKALYEAAFTTSFYTADPVAADVMLSLSSEQARRDNTRDEPSTPDASHFQQSWWAALDARRFDEAAEFYAQHHEQIDNPLADDHPQRVSETEAHPIRLLQTDHEEAGIRLLKDGVDLTGRWVVASVSTACHFSARALDYIDALDASDYPGERLLLVSGQRGTGRPLTGIADWNREATQAVIAIAWQNAEWPETVAFSATPVFFFLEEGELQDRRRGWPSDEHGAELLKDIRAFLGRD